MGGPVLTVKSACNRTVLSYNYPQFERVSYLMREACDWWRPGGFGGMVVTPT